MSSDLYTNILHLIHLKGFTTTPLLLMFEKHHSWLRECRLFHCFCVTYCLTLFPVLWFLLLIFYWSTSQRHCSKVWCTHVVPKTLLWKD